MRQGARRMLRMFASQSDRIAVAASPELRKTAFTTKSKKIVTLPPSMTPVYLEP
jgi:hypothetical protein